MHLDPTRALFEDRPGGGRSALVRCVVLLIVLVANAWLASFSTVLLAGAIGLFVLLAERAARARWGFLAFGLAQIAAAAGFCQLCGVPSARYGLVAARGAAGLTWILWFGATTSWPRLKHGLGRAGVPPACTDVIDDAVAHGELLLGEVERRRQAATLRLGFRRSPLATATDVLTGGVERAFDRAQALDAARRLRSAAPRPEVAEPALLLHRVSAGYSDGVPQILDIDLQVAAGRWVALAGPSGSGKSTLLRTLAGLLPVKSGRLARFGVEVAGPLRKRIDGRVALVTQDPSDQLFGSTPLDDLIWGLRHLGVQDDAACERARSTLTALEIESLADRPIHQLSFGERKRVAFASALVCRPALLLCDEPTIGLDPVAARRLVTALERVAVGTTVLWATHDLANLPRPIDRIVLLREGRLWRDGARAELSRHATLVEACLAYGEEVQS